MLALHFSINCYFSLFAQSRVLLLPIIASLVQAAMQQLHHGAKGAVLLLSCVLHRANRHSLICLNSLLLLLLLLLLLILVPVCRAVMVLDLALLATQTAALVVVSWRHW
jgi:hypothetical protein